ncbi:hypothetical protein HOLleu_28287 [Holothuria leucospilota]|uniref:Uncharacterized protein n=1 Tax=Holothuria leucospilota TaxID=206669 RepID=A0A9Q1H1C9_HOLLE|nr:hypothetical protein HOLleu_28287 [Holothuria leucospilota]
MGQTLKTLFPRYLKGSKENSLLLLFCRCRCGDSSLSGNTVGISYNPQPTGAMMGIYCTIKISYIADEVGCTPGLKHSCKDEDKQPCVALIVVGSEPGSLRLVFGGRQLLKEWKYKKNWHI